MRKVYFQGWGLALTEDYAGGHAVRDEDGNAIGPGDEPADVEVHEGAQCDTHEWYAFLEA